MRSAFLLFLWLFLLSNANAQGLTELLPIEPTSEVWDYYVERSAPGRGPVLLAFLSGGGLKIYNSKRDVLITLDGMKGCVRWGDTYLQKGRLYFFSEKLQVVELEENKASVRKLDSRPLQRADYESFLGVETDSSRLLLCSYPMGVDVYRFPSLELIAQLNREEYLKHPPCIFWQGILIDAVRQNLLVGYDVAQKQIVWRLSSGEFHPKFLGISIGTLPRRFSRWRVNPQDQTLYASTFDGSIYKLSPQTGTVVLQKLQFRGSGNNAGLLTHLYFLDVTGDGKNDLVAPSVDDNVYCVHPTDLSVQWAYDTDNECQMRLAFFDITGDGNPEIFCVNDYDLALSIIDGKTGQTVGQYSLKDNGPYRQIRISVADIDGDGTPELLAQSSTWKKIRVFRIPTATPSK